MLHGHNQRERNSIRLRRGLRRHLTLHGRLLGVQLLAVVTTLSGFAVAAVACEGGGGGGKELTSLSTSLSGGGKEGETITVAEGTKVKDKATLTGKNASKATGKATYKVYSEKECKTLVVSAGEVTVSGESVPASSEEELEAGKTYYWQAHYGGDTNNNESTSPCTEILTVQAKTTLSTKLSGESKEAEELTVLEGAKAKDKATLSGTNSSTATGKVLYKIFSEKECKTLVKEAGEVTLESGAKIPASTEEELEAGKTYYWQATYKGDSLHKESVSTCGKEILNVKAKTTLTTKLSGEGKEGEEITVLEGTKVKDTSTLSGTNSSAATGKVTYKVYSDNKCESLVTTAGEVTVESGGKVPASNEEELKVGTYYWQASYTGDLLHEESKSSCSEILNVKTATSLSTSLSGESEEGEEIEALENTAITDHASLSGTNASKAGGTVTYKVYSDKECKTLVAEAGEVTVTSGSVPASKEEKLKAGTYYWQASYSGDSKNQASTSTCGSEVSIVNVETSISTSLAGEEGKTGTEIEVHEENSAIDTATLSGTKASKATGSVVYDVYSNNTCTELAAEAGTVDVSEGVVPASEAVTLSAGTYYWRAFYSGEELNHGSKSPCTEVEVVTAPSLTTSLSGESKSGAEIEVHEGASVGDNATLHIKNSSTATGTVKYDVYSDDECKELAAEAGEVTVTAGSIPESKKETLGLGTHYWRASYSGDETHPSATSACGTEIERVRDSTSLSTSLSGESKSGAEITVEEGADVSDTATLSGTKASEATGTVEYNVYSNGTCTEPAAEESTVSVSGGAVPASAEVALAAGTYYWQATYYGNSANQSSTSTCGAEKEVVKEALTTSLSGASKSGEEIELQEEAPVHDTATLHEEKSSTATGTVKYYVYSDSECKDLVTKAGEVTVTGGSIPSSSEETVAEGEYYWQAVYSGDSSHPAATSVCGKEVEKVNPPWIVSVGDSYISGEAGRWAGNTANNSEWRLIDALGSEAYFGAPNNEAGKEAIPYCHRSKSAEIFIGGGVRSKNLACSGAETTSSRSSVPWPPLTPTFKPGLDFADVAQGRMLPGNRGKCPLATCEGQALQLEKFAEERKQAKEKIKMVVVSIGGDNFGFAEVVKACIKAFWWSVVGINKECNTEAALKAKFEAANVKVQEEAIEAGIEHVGQAMERAGFAKGTYTIVVQDYPSPIPENAGEFRYPATSVRQVTGGCPFGNNDAKWANATALIKIDETVKKAAETVNGEGNYKVVFMELKEAFNGRRLCEKNVATNLQLVGEELANWRAQGAVDKSEWINQVRLVTAGTQFLWQEDLHPNYWGQLALRNCTRKAYTNGAPKGGTCKIEAAGLTPARGGVPPVRRREPLMELK